MQFEDQHAIITGGSSGIGKATAHLLATKGAHISLIARSQERLAEAKAEIEDACSHPNQRVLTFSADVSDPKQAEQAIQAAIAQNGPPAVLVTAAGITHPGYFSEIPLDVFQQMMDVDYFGTLYAVRAVVPLMQAQRRGHLVLISSGAGLVGVYGYSAYSPAKFAVRGLGEALRGELKPYGIHISLVYPPDTDTPQLAEENKIKPAETKAIAGSTKIWSAEGVAQAIVRGIERNSFVVAPGTDMALLARLHSLIAPGLNRYMDWVASKARH